MSISTIVTRGFGSWGSVNDVVTRGFGIGESVAAPIRNTSKVVHAVGVTAKTIRDAGHTSTIVSSRRKSKFTH